MLWNFRCILASRKAANRDASQVPMFLVEANYLILIGLRYYFKKVGRSIVILDRDAAMLELRNINKVFGNKPNLSNSSLSIPEKQILAIVGPSGGGKTTHLRKLEGIETIDKGKTFTVDELQSIYDLHKAIYWNLFNKIMKFYSSIRTGKLNNISLRK